MSYVQQMRWLAQALPAVVLGATVTVGQARGQQAYKWDGIYAGLTIGGALSRGDIGGTATDNYRSVITGRSPFTLTDDTSSIFGASGHGSGVLGGALLGYSLDVGKNFVVSAELEGNLADITFSGRGNWTSTETVRATGSVNYFNTATWQTAAEAKAKVNGTVAAVARLGYLFDPSLLAYALVGRAYARASTDDLVADGTSFNMWGWTTGAGVEKKLLPNFGVRFEYRYTDYGSGGPAIQGSSRRVTASQVETLSISGSEEFRLQTHAFRVGAIVSF